MGRRNAGMGHVVAAPTVQLPCIPRVGSRHPLWEGRIGERATRLEEGPPLDDGHQAVSTTALDAEPAAILPMPGDSLWPFYLSVATLFLFYALLFDRWIVAVLAAVATVACLVGGSGRGHPSRGFRSPRNRVRGRHRPAAATTCAPCPPGTRSSGTRRDSGQWRC